MYKNESFHWILLYHVINKAVARQYHTIMGLQSRQDKSKANNEPEQNSQRLV